jgi:hypothetical protein
MIRDILNSTQFVSPKDGVINMGYQNGWGFSPEISQLYRSLREYEVDGSGGSRSIGDCETEYYCVIDDGVDRYRLISKVDSSG